MSKTTSRQSNGRYIDLANITAADIDLYAISTSLNYQYRFNGHHRDKEPLTVAQHTKLCLDICDIMFPDDLPTKMDVLLHDMPEAFYGDVVSPIKSIVKELFKPYCKTVDDVLYSVLWPKGVPYSSEIYDRRVICDLTSLDFERRNMWSSQLGKENWPMDTTKLGFNMRMIHTMFDTVQANRYVNLVGMYVELVSQMADLQVTGTFNGTVENAKAA